MRKILGLDLGTNSIGWALIEQDSKGFKGEILGMGSRIIPMSQDILGNFGKGNSISQTAERTKHRGVRRLRERYLLRRERLHRVLHILGFLPKHYDEQIDFSNRLGKFKNNSEPKLAYNQSRFLFKNAFDEMLNDFKIHQPMLLKGEDGKDKLIPYDWTIYYLRKKALSQKITNEELAWLLLNFNQKRGYYQLRGEEEEENPNKLIEFHALKVTNIVPDEKLNHKKEQWYSLELENGWIYRRMSTYSLNNLNEKIIELIVTTNLDDEGNVKLDKDGVEKRSFRMPKEDDWNLVKNKTEKEVSESSKKVGTYIYDTLLQNPKQKIKGKLIRTIERKFYKEELEAILKKQVELNADLQNKALLASCARELYQYNEGHYNSLVVKDFSHLFIDDILFYQRPLKSKKSLIANCSREYHTYTKEGETFKSYLKAIHKSHPLYQEFRIWQWIDNLAIYRREDDTNITAEFLKTTENKVLLFEFLVMKKEIKQEQLLKYLLKDSTLKGVALNKEIAKYRWNYVEDKPYPCGETKALLLDKLKKVEGLPKTFLSTEREEQLWHIIYSVTDKEQYEIALATFAKKNTIDTDSFVESFRRIPPFKAEYGNYSNKAISKLLNLMRKGKYWHWDAIDKDTKNRVQKLIDGEFDNKIQDRVREKAIELKREEDFQGLPFWLANYIVYDKHSEATEIGKWNTVQDLEDHINKFKQHSLRNPIVEQVITETLRVVKDIWIQYGKGEENFFDEIHIELGRDMKNPKDVRKQLTDSITKNENTNERIKLLLMELQQDGLNVRPYSPSQQDILKIFEEGVLNSAIEIGDDILKISQKPNPTKQELTKYKLWLEQKYQSPYTGDFILLSELFTEKYEIEHIIPQSKFFDDSLSNKIICESAINRLKDNQLGYEFIRNHEGEKVEIGFGKVITIFSSAQYESFVKQHYSKNNSKRNKLLMEEIPEKMIMRQLNDTRYISKYVQSLLSYLVRNEDKDDGVNSKNIISSNGQITSRLKQDWGLNKVWNALVLHRFERMNALTNSTDYTAYSERYQCIIPTVPFELQKGFTVKRIDHRHHALDALIVACATSNHINLLNNLYAKSKQRFGLNKLLRHYETVKYKHPKTGDLIERDIPKAFKLPWEGFVNETKEHLEKIVVSFKQNLRVINKTVNYYQNFKDEEGNLNLNKNGKPIQKERKQTKGDQWAIRKPMHKETVGGIVKLRKTKTVKLSSAIQDVNNIVDKSLKRKINKLYNSGLDNKEITKYFKELKNQFNDRDISKVYIYYFEVDSEGNGLNVASRVALDTSFNEKKIDSITDTGIQKILMNHLENYKGKLDDKKKPISPNLLAFIPEGLEELNKNIIELNEGKFHQPIFKVRTYEAKGKKFPVGQTGNKPYKFVTSEKGTNLFLAIYLNEEGERTYETIPLNEVIEHQKWHATLSKTERKKTPMIPTNREKGVFIFSLSPDDLVYVPAEKERENPQLVNFNNLNKVQAQKIYKVEKTSGTECYFVRNDIAFLIKQYGAKTEIEIDTNTKMGELASQNKLETTMCDLKLKIVDHCWKLKVDRLGNVSKV